MIKFIIKTILQFTALRALYPFYWFYSSTGSPAESILALRHSFYQGTALEIKRAEMV